MDTFACLLLAAVAIDRRTFSAKCSYMCIAVAPPRCIVQDSGHLRWTDNRVTPLLKGHTAVSNAENVVFPDNFYR